MTRNQSRFLDRRRTSPGAGWERNRGRRTATLRAIHPRVRGRALLRGERTGQARSGEDHHLAGRRRTPAVSAVVPLEGAPSGRSAGSSGWPARCPRRQVDLHLARVRVTIVIRVRVEAEQRGRPGPGVPGDAPGCVSATSSTGRTRSSGARPSSRGWRTASPSPFPPAGVVAPSHRGEATAPATVRRTSPGR